MIGQTPPPAPACIAKALASYWRANGLEGHRVDRWDRKMADRIWEAMLREGKVEVEYDHQVFTLPLKRDE